MSGVLLSGGLRGQAYIDWMSVDDNWRRVLRLELRGMDDQQLRGMFDRSIADTKTGACCSFDPQRALLFLVELLDEIQSRRVIRYPKRPSLNLYLPFG